jgi:YidC/Oxa1 family membrane protein insertase
MEKRILIAFLLSFAVLYGARFLYPPPAPKKPDVEAKTPAPAPPAPPATQPTPVATNGEVIQAESAEDVLVETPLYRAVISNVGGILKSFRLTEPKYKDHEGKPTELIDPYAGTQVGFPLAITTSDPALDRLLFEAKFVVERETGGRKVSLEYRNGGVHAVKVFDFDSDKYLVRISSRLERNGAEVPHQIVWQGEFGDQSILDVPAKRRAIYYSAGKYLRIPVTSIKDPQEIPASSAGAEDQYFLAMFVREKEGPIKIGKQEYKLADRPDGTKGAAALGLSVAVPATEDMEIYIGPKLQDSLVQADSKLDGVLDFGWFLFAIIAKPLLVMLLFINGYIGNYGWSIVILTILINMVLFPLRVKQQVVMQRMQKHAPHLRQLQDKYKKLKPGDPRRAEVEKEIMEMNKQQLSGCLPMLMQMPLLFAFLNMMSAAIQLRGAPWILWIKDLSQPDIVLPILFGLAMFVQMKLGPTSPDPAQAKMAYLTPVLITVLFLWYGSASGLSLYWLTGNVIGIGQQWFIKKHWSDDDTKPRQRRQSASD